MVNNLTRKELAEKLRVHPETIGTWTRERRIPCLRLGRKYVRYNLDAVLAALEASGKTKE